MSDNVGQRGYDGQWDCAIRSHQGRGNHPEQRVDIETGQSIVVGLQEEIAWSSRTPLTTLASGLQRLGRGNGTITAGERMMVLLLLNRQRRRMMSV